MLRSWWRQFPLPRFRKKRNDRYVAATNALRNDCKLYFAVFLLPR